MKETIWDIFRLTGDIKYYMLYKEMENMELDEQDQSEGNNY